MTRFAGFVMTSLLAAGGVLQQDDDDDGNEPSPLEDDGGDGRGSEPEPSPEPNASEDPDDDVAPDAGDDDAPDEPGDAGGDPDADRDAAVTSDAGEALPGDAGRPERDASPTTDAAPSDPDADEDGDGYRGIDGDCDDRNADVNPEAWDFPGNSIDEDCSGSADDGDRSCDDGLAIDDTDPLNAVRALGLCKMTTEASNEWGVISAAYVFADGSIGEGGDNVGEAPNPVQHGLLPRFGDGIPQPLQGGALLALSSGTARDASQEGFESAINASFGTSSAMPPGFPVESDGCAAGGELANDPIALEIRMRVPTNVESFAFAFNYFTAEFPSFVCSSWNDYFVALQDPAPSNASLGNISFDGEGNPISVNAVFLEVCEPQFAGNRDFTCPRGETQLAGTGFEGNGATGWLETRSPVEPGSIVTLRFATWDTGDWTWNGTVLLDDFRWLSEELAGEDPITVYYDE